MIGKRSGVATTIKNELNRNVLAIHCHVHALNPACGDSIKNYKLMLSKHLLKFRCIPKRESQLINIHARDCLLSMPNKIKQKLLEFLVIHDG